MGATCHAHATQIRYPHMLAATCTCTCIFDSLWYWKLSSTCTLYIRETLRHGCTCTVHAWYIVCVHVYHIVLCAGCTCAGVTAGGIGSFIGTPAEISLIRMTSDGRSVSTVHVHVHVYMYTCMCTS